MRVIKIEMKRDASRDSVWDLPFEQHRNLRRDAAWCAIVLAATAAILARLA